jgi:hypothetical protein
MKPTVMPSDSGSSTDAAVFWNRRVERVKGGTRVVILDGDVYGRKGKEAEIIVEG